LEYRKIDTQKTIAIDFDDTYTADPELFNLFIATAASRGHRVIICTCRQDTEPNREAIDGFLEAAKAPEIPVFYTDLAPKEHFLRQRRGIEVDIWIDDVPDCVQNGR